MRDDNLIIIQRIFKKSMIYFLYGSDRYRIQEKEREILSQLLANDQSNINFDKFDGEEIKFASFDSAISSNSFFGGSRVVLIQDLITKNKDKELKARIAERIKKNVNADILFIEFGQPDKREKLFKTLIKTAKVEVFEPLREYEIKKWIKEKVEKSGGQISLLGIESLALAVGSNLNQLENEINKLILYVKSQNKDQIDQNDVGEMVKSLSDPNIFDFIESIARRNKKQAVKLLTEFINKGEDESMLISMVIYQFRILIIVKDLLDRGKPAHSIASEAKLNPYVVQKSLPILRSYSLDDLIDHYQFLYQIDLKIKTGQIEPKVAIDFVVAGG